MGGPMNSAIYRQLLGTLVTTEPNKCDAHRIAPHRDPIQPSHTQSTYSSKARKTHDVIYFLKGNCTRTSKTMFPSEKQEPRKTRKPRKPRKPRKTKKTKKKTKKPKKKKPKKLKKTKNQ